MTVNSASGTPFEGLHEAGAREDDILCLLLLYHCHVLNERSPFKKHLDALPREYHQTIFYTGARSRNSLQLGFAWIRLLSFARIRADPLAWICVADFSLDRILNSFYTRSRHASILL